MKNNNKSTKLSQETMQCVLSGNLDDSRKIISGSPEIVSLGDEHGATMLHHVAMPNTDGYRFPNQVETAKLLIAAGAAVNALTTQTGETPLHWAASADNIDVARILLEQGADIEALDAAGHTLMEDAIFFGAPVAAQALVQLGAAVSSLTLAAGLGDLVLVKKLMPDLLNAEHNQSLSEVDVKTRQVLEKALSIACMNGQRTVAEYLLALGVDLNSKTLDSHSARTPLHWAVYRDQPEIVKLLIHHGANLAALDDTYEATPLDWAKIHQRHEIQRILESAANEAGLPGHG